MDEDSMWCDGLACPPLEDYAFNFDAGFITSDHHMFDDRFLQLEELDKMVAVACMANPPTPLSDHLLDFQNSPVVIPTPSHGKGKEMSTLKLLLLQVEDGSRRDQVVALDHKRKDVDNHELRSKGKVTRLSDGSKRKHDYDLELEVSGQKLREGYQRDREAKQNKKIQLIDFQIPIVKTQQPRCNAKTKGKKPSLRQRLMMATGTRKTGKKKFPQLQAISSCVY
ncbi:hypothetical protein OROGR_029794 [Orobanche gracilis]